MAKMAVSIHADAEGLKEIGAMLRRAGGELFLETRAAEVQIAEQVAADARQRASFSSRIPQTIKVSRTRGLGVQITAGGASAPHAAAIENRGQGYVRHPTFGGDPWTDLNSHPAFLQPALDAHRAQLDLEIEVLLTGAVTRALERR